MDRNKIDECTTDNKPRVRHAMRRDGANLYVDIWFDEFKTERLIVGGDETIARMVESGELRLTADSKLKFEDGTPAIFRQLGGQTYVGTRF